VKIRTLPVGADWKADVSKLKSMINKNTIFIAGSAPGFPHGVIDDIPAMAAIALEHKVPFHVDMCLGGFLLPFLKKLGHIKDSFDFKVPGVTSISADAHKYGGCPKGNSVIMYNSKKLRQLQFFAAVNWSGGLYCSPSFQGSRPGGLIAGCYAHMINTGMDGYLKHADNLNTAFVKCVTAIQGIEGLEVMGEPAACIIGVNSSTFNILQWADVMDDKGWDITRLQKPSCIHIPIGTRQIPVLDDFIADMKDATRIVKCNPEEMPEEGMAQIYGMAGSVPDRGTITDLLFDYMDILLTV
jgi:sphinganine-1-phosphate aldolase